MEKSIILQLMYYGSRYFERVKLFGIEEYDENINKVNEICEKLCAGLSEEEKYKTIYELDLARGGMEKVAAAEYFKAGFKLGLTLGAQNFLD